MIALTVTFQKIIPGLSLTKDEYSMRLGSGTREEGCWPIPRTAGIVSEPGRERARERKRDDGAVDIGVREKRLDAQAAPSGLLFVTGGISNAIREFRGGAKPRTPLKLGASSSFSISSAAAKHKIRQRRLTGKRERNYQVLDYQ